LLVQFENDDFDQSARLARTILASTRDSSTVTKNIGEDNGNDANDDSSEGKIDLKFARLRGTHLTPISYTNDFGVIKMWQRMASIPIDDVLMEVLGEEKKQRKTTSKHHNKGDINDLIDSIVEYIARLTEKHP